MPELSSVVSFLDTLLDVSAFNDYCPNGLQVQGRGDVRRVVTGVSACRELFEAAVARGADMVVVHHGLFWANQWPLRLRGAMRERVKLLLDNDVSLLGYHLPLDAHPELGNNAQIARLLGLQSTRAFGLYKGRPIGIAGQLPTPGDLPALEQQLETLFGEPPLTLPGRREPIETVGVISGGAGSEYEQAVHEGLDAYITGEPTEPAMHLAREEGVHFLACGHHRTERYGIQALGDKLTEAFALEVQFVDLPNPV